MLLSVERTINVGRMIRLKLRTLSRDLRADNLLKQHVNEVFVSNLITHPPNHAMCMWLGSCGFGGKV